MCAISGIFIDEKNNRTIDLSKSVDSMIEVMNHRGPDDRGKCFVRRSGDETSEYALGSNLDSYNNLSACLGFNRLSIRDLSMNGHQPMIDDGNKIVIVFNGEIYNSEELKAEYLQDCSFRSTTDTEVILKMYKKYGIDKTIRILDGMFALCIVDAESGRLYIARDRVGIKPLYVYNKKGVFAFASEMKAILAAKLFRPEIDIEGFYETMMFSFSYKKTLIKDINWFEAGTYASAELSNLENMTIVRYWSPEEYVKSENISYERSVNRLKCVLSDTVKSQMVSDVFVGCQLSGGVDSSLITNYFAESKAKVSNKDKIRNVSFGIIPENKELSEESYMDAVADRTGIEIKKITVENSWVYSQWKNAIWFLDGIPSFTNELGIKALALGAKESGVTVLMSGEGADEVFGGYSHITDGEGVLKQYKLRKLVHKEKQYLMNKNLYEEAFAGDLTEQYYLLYSADGNFNDFVKAVCPEMEIYRKAACNDRLSVIERIMSHQEITLFDKSRCYDLAVRVGALCNRQDKMTMAASIENRVPFLSNVVIEQGLSMPQQYLSRTMLKPKPRRGRNPFMKQGKFALKDICRSIFGEDFTFRYKQGFPLPLEDFIVEFINSHEFEDTLKRLDSRGLVDAEVVRKYCTIMKSHRTFYSGEARVLWRLFSIELFCEQFIDTYEA